VAAVVVAVLLLFPSPASAHAELASSDPEQDARLASAPARVVLTFTEGVELGPGQLKVFAPDGTRVETGRPEHAGGRPTTAAVGLRPGLGEGTYTVVWLVLSADSHPVRGAFTFVVGTPSTTTAAVEMGLADPLVSRLLGVARWLAFGGFAVLVGCVAFVLVCWPEGAAVPGVRRLAVAGWATLLTATVARALLEGPYAAGESVAGVLDGSLLATTLGTRLGNALMVRVGLLGLVGAVGEWALRRVPAAPPRERLGIGAGAAAVTLALAATWSAADHASTGPQVALALPADMAHLTAMAVWLGGLVLLATVLLRAGAHPQAAVRRAVPRFSRLALGCVATLVVTGTYQAWRQAGSVRALTDSAYGQLLIIKLGLFAVVLCLGLISRRWVRQWAAARTAGDGPGSAGVDADTLRRSVAAETVVAAMALAVTAALVNTVPARAAGGRTAPPAAPAAVVNGAADFRAGPGDAGSVTMFVEPGRVGSNIVHLAVWDTRNVPRSVPEVRATLTQPERGIGPVPVRLSPDGPGRYIGLSTVLPAPGRWRLTVSIRTTEVDEATVTFPLTIT
jgi:copper transport protein